MTCEIVRRKQNSVKVPLITVILFLFRLNQPMFSTLITGTYDIFEIDEAESSCLC